MAKVSSSTLVNSIIFPTSGIVFMLFDAQYHLNDVMLKELFCRYVISCRYVHSGIHYQFCVHVCVAIAEACWCSKTFTNFARFFIKMYAFEYYLLAQTYWQWRVESGGCPGPESIFTPWSSVLTSKNPIWCVPGTRWIILKYFNVKALTCRKKSPFLPPLCCAPGTTTPPALPSALYCI